MTRDMSRITSPKSKEEVYRIIKKLQENNGVTTVKAQSDKSGSYFILKYAEKDDRIGRELISKEARFRMIHPFIERIYTDFETTLDGRKIHVVVGEWIEGTDLKTYWTGRIPDSAEEENKNERRMYRHMMQLLYAVKYYEMCADKGKGTYVHRDLSPVNVMLSEKDKYDNIIIIDFGISHIAGDSNGEKKKKTIVSSYGTVGTEGYADPRQISKGDYWKDSIQLDIYSLGRLFCFLLKRDDYFSEEEASRYQDCDELAYGVEETRFLKKYQTEKYQKLIKIIKKMVARPEERYMSIAEIITEMKRFLHDIYTNEVYQNIVKTKTFLQNLHEYDLETKIKVRLYFSDGIGNASYILKEYRMHQIEKNDKPLMTLYNLQGRLYYIPQNPAVVRNGKSTSYEIMNSDCFEYEGETFRFELS